MVGKGIRSGRIQRRTGAKLDKGSQLLLDRMTVETVIWWKGIMIAKITTPNWKKKTVCEANLVSLLIVVILNLCSDLC